MSSAGKLLSFIGIVITLSSFAFSIYQYNERSKIAEPNRGNAWGAYKQWISIYSNFEALANANAGYDKDRYVKENKGTFAFLNDTTIKNIWYLYESDSQEEMLILLEGWRNYGLVPDYAEDEFRAQIKAIAQGN